MSNDETVSFSLEINVEEAYTNLRKVQMVLFRFLGLLRKMGLPENLDNAIATLQRFIAFANQARLAAIALAGASGPVGWAIAGVSIATTAFTFADTLEYSMRGT